MSRSGEALDMQEDKQKEKKYYWALILSLLLHVLALSLSFQKRETVSQKPKKQIKVVKIQLEKPKKEKKQNEATKKIKEMPRQIVNNDLSGRKERPENTRFLGEKNQKYDRQTIAKKVDIFKKAGRGRKKGSRKKIAASKKIAKKAAQKMKAVSSSKSKGPFKLTDLGLSSETQDLAKFKVKPSDSNPSEALGLKNGENNKSGLASNNDFIEDVPLGDMTHLNTQEFKYFGFYHRIRQKLEQYWGNSIREKAQELFKKGRRIASNENLITSLVITLDSKGNIVKVRVQGSSGIQELDSAAIESFNRAGPFPNPPRGMIKNGIAVINWGFVVKS